MEPQPNTWRNKIIARCEESKMEQIEEKKNKNFKVKERNARE